jgi:hypothetical protein
VPIPAVAKRLGDGNANITLSIYAHAHEADELAAAKIWDDAMADVIGANKRRLNGNPAKSSAEALEKLEVIEKKAGGFGGDDGARTRDLRRDRPAL